MQRKTKIIIAATVVVILAIVTTVSVVLVVTGGETENLQKSTKNGYVKGTIERTFYSNKKYYSFRGIPFAEPPVGDLRFEKPQPKSNWEGTLDASKFQSDCIQQFASGGTEDCLYLNVFTPDMNAKDLPVMVWVYGGAFIKGRSSEYKPDNFMEEDVIIVTFNYRLGIFGFFTLEEEESPSNAGLYDQVLALNWVKDNIASFGGSPDKVTIFGESAGAASVSYLVQSKLTEGLFRAAIMESGCTLDVWALARNKRGSILAAANILGINTTDSKSILEGFRNVEANDLALVSISVDASNMIIDNPMNGILFSPSKELDPEGIVTGRSYEKLSKGDFNQVPLIVGINSEEGLLFYSILNLLLIYINGYLIWPERLVPISMHANETQIKDIGEKIKNIYFSRIDNATDLQAEIVSYVSENEFERPINKAAELYSTYTPTYFYRYTYVDPSNNRTIPGASHGEEVANLFPPEEIHTDLQQKMVKLWTNFAKHLNPTPILDPILDNQIWQQYSTVNYTYLEISETLDVKSEPFNTNFKFWDELFDENSNDIDTF